MKAAGQDPLINSIHKEGGLEGLVEWFDSSLENPIEGLTTQQAFDNISLRLGQSAPINNADVEATLLNPKYAPFVNAKSFSQATYHLSVNKPGHVVEQLSTQNENLGNNEIRGMLKKVVGTSTRKGLFNMGDWLNQNQDHPLYDISTRYFVEYAARTDQETAAGWAEKIGDETLRAEAEKILQR